MSLAVSAVIKPSIALFAMTSVMCIGTGIFSVLGWTGVLHPTIILILGASTLLTFFGFYCAVSKRKAYKIDISGAGQIRLVALKPGADAPFANMWTSDEERCNVVQLLPNSTLWPFLLLLRLQGDSGKITVLPILFDSVSFSSFRALAVACRWIAAHNSPGEHNIL